MRRSPRALVAICAAIAVACTTVAIVCADLSTLHRRAASLGRPRSVLVAVHDLPLGATLGATDVRSVTRYALSVPADAVGDRHDATGRIVAVPVVAGAVLQRAQLAPADRDGLTGLVPVGSRAVRVRPDDGMAPPIGAVVDVFAAVDASVDATAEATTVAHAARVLAVDTDRATDDSSGVGVTLLVTANEARGLAFAAANGVLTLALAPPEDACCSSPGS
jgi:Flp pilus assembly protein CpaB